MVCIVFPPGGSEWIISVEDYVNNSFTALGVAIPGKLGSSSSQLLCFSFSICSSPFCFLLNVFHDTFSMSYKILTILCLLILSPPRGQWMDYRCRLVRKFIHCFWAQRPREKIGLSYSLGLWDFIFSCQLYFFPCSRISSQLILFLCLISFLLFPCASVWENTRA